VDIGYLRGQVNSIKDEALRTRLLNIVEHIANDFRFGAPAHQTRSQNAQLYWQNSTTATSTGEFSLTHGLNATPKYAIPVLELDKPGAKLVPLEVSRAADNRRLYLKSTSTSAPILLLIE
jgi:hypothetical protein